MAQDLIRYDLLAQEALRGVVRVVLADVAKNGLPGDHHFFIGFSTQAPGVRISNRLRESYPEEMTVVLQHQFWDLEVTDTSFSISLSFNGMPERLVVPYSAIKGFLDPSVQFGLQFDSGASTDAADEASPAAPVAPAEAGIELPAEPADPTASEPVPAKPKRVKSRKATAKTTGKSKPADPETDSEAPADAEPASGAEVVSLDKFRKKN